MSLPRILLCPVCVEQKLKSKVYYGGSSGSAMTVSQFWDENGVYHQHDPNTYVNYYRCSNKHTFEQRAGNRCPECGQ